ncbi:MAG: HAD hydrolase-like protein [Planctomycetota bacterium]
MTPPVAGAVFDLDGTLTAPGAIDFARIRERIGMRERGSILHWIEANVSDSAAVQEMHAVIHEEEDRGLERMALGDGFDALARAILARGPHLRTAICTRNSGTALEAFDALLRRSGYPPSAELFHVQLARDHHSEFLGRSIANKPSHEPAHEIVRLWGWTERFAPHVAHEHDDAVHEKLLFLGDDIDDCLAARRAGLRSGLVLHGATRAPDDPIHRAVDATYEDLDGVAAALGAVEARRE